MSGASEMSAGAGGAARDVGAAGASAGVGGPSAAAGGVGGSAGVGGPSAAAGAAGASAGVGAPLFDAEVFFDATTGPVRLSHPECVAFDADGNAWCGGDRGEIYRIAADGSAIEQVASTGGFVLGVALDGQGFLYACDLAERALFRVELASGAIERFADAGGAMATPNFAVVDPGRGCLYLSDSRAIAEPGVAIWRVALDGGDAEPWHPGPLDFANGMALSADGDALYVAETWARRIVRVPIAADGSAGAAEPVVETPGALPDGIALDADGRLYIACYEPSRVYRHDPRGGVAGEVGGGVARSVAGGGAGGVARSEPGGGARGVAPSKPGGGARGEARSAAGGGTGRGVAPSEPGGGAGLELLLDDPTAHVLCHPTNCAFRGEELFVANLGRWHLSRAAVGAAGLELPGQRSG
ncbi:SMP-30/gluconolactonase/LRE family protein [Conexibacter arvalis]|uniref:Sugar lactone lactonase YvrE n=1 Tax=Conexibacter arvalis TaxID=912552 RepID=A0A840IFJ5_9ACTN|nr:SMP-30/gluconolactonase/LRE family protein [Conexibacter arvalis]MBB4662834.1 sugar lactone lactonase YvrE [Conexibacter arvalis]